MNQKEILNQMKVKVEFHSKVHDEKVKGTDDMGKIVWVPKKLLKQING